MKVGIIGNHGSGKSIIFKSLTGIEEEHREASGVGVVEVYDERLDELHTLYPDKKKIYTRLDIIDAGVFNPKDELIRKCDAFLLVVGGFFGEKPENIWNDIKADMIISDQNVIEKRLKLLKKEHKKENEREEKLLEKTLDIIKNEIRLIESGESEGKLLKGFSLFTYKPVFVVINISEKQEEKDFLITKESLGIPSLVFKGKLEADLQDLDKEERAEYMDLYGMKESAIDRVIKALYSEIGLITFFTTLGDEVRGWRLKEGSSILEAAGSIHSDMEKGFIKADVISVSQLFNAGSEKNAKEKGLIHLVGRDYIVKDGDVLKIRFA